LAAGRAHPDHHSACPDLALTSVRTPLTWII
jgi:hypothetical protein